MTPDDFDKRYRLLSQQSSGGVESWLGESTESQRTVAIHRLVTGRAIGLLDMLSHLDVDQRGRVIEQFIVAGIPVVITEPLPDSVSFVEWLENNVPSTVTAVIRPLRPKPPQAEARIPEQPVVAASELAAPTRDGSEDDTGNETPEIADELADTSSASDIHSSLIQGLTAIFAEQEMEALRKARQNAAITRPATDGINQPLPPPQPAPTTDARFVARAQATPATRPERVTPVAQAEPGLTAIFEASEVRQRLDEARARATPTELPHLPEPQFDPPLLEASRARGEAEKLAFRPRSEETPIVSPSRDDSFQGAELEMPKYQLGFDDAPVLRDQPPPVESRIPTLDDSPLLEESSYTQVLKPRYTPATNHEPAMIPPPPPPQRKLSAIWVVIAVVTLAVATTVVLLAVRWGLGGSVTAVSK